jgi:hypothetical protein
MLRRCLTVISNMSAFSSFEWLVCKYDIATFIITATYNYIGRLHTPTTYGIHLKETSRKKAYRLVTAQTSDIAVNFLHQILMSKVFVLIIS